LKQYIYGRKTIVESDCKPVISIMKKPLCAAPQRLQKLLMQLQPFDIEVVHKKGSNIPIGDALSRNYAKETYPELFANMDTHVHTVKSLPISDQKIEKIRAETQNDMQLQAVKLAILEGWPEERKLCNKLAIDFWNHRDEMSYEDGIILRGSKIVIPKALQLDMIEAVHMNHLGCQKATNRARDIMFWPGMTKQITDFVLACPLCEKYRPANTKEPLLPHDIPDRSWQNVSCDLFTFENKQYMVLVDGFSHHLEIDHLPDISSKTVVRKLKVHFSRFGCPEELKSDNAKQFRSDEFDRFAKDWNFRHITSSPMMASSNGKAESAVKIAKRILRKAKDANTDPYMALLEFRNTPLPCGYSPAQLLMSRRLRSILPTTNNQLKPELVDIKSARESMQAMRAKSKAYHDRNAKPLPPLKPGDRVTYQNGNIWEPAKIVSPYNSRSYVIETPDGVQYRRNRKFINKSGTDQHSAAPAKNVPCAPPLPVQSFTPKNSQTNSRQQYVTSKGREVRPPAVYLNNEWVK
jgi:Integrase zinc binding domain/Integrase core domain